MLTTTTTTSDTCQGIGAGPSSVEVCLGGERAWQFFLDDDGNTGGVSIQDAETLKKVALALDNAVGQVRGHLALITDKL